jgi:hypothetical protein
LRIKNSKIRTFLVKNRRKNRRKNENASYFVFLEVQLWHREKCLRGGAKLESGLLRLFELPPVFAGSFGAHE